MGDLWKAVWNLFQTELTLPYIGTWSILDIEIFLALLSLAVWFVAKLIGVDQD